MAHQHLVPRSQSAPTRKRRRRGLGRWWKLLIPISPLLLPIGWIGYREVENTWIKPQAIFVLGGEEEREIFGAKFAHTHPHLPVWISSGAPPNYAKKVFKKAGVSADNLHLDYRAIDTVTNFTTLVDRFKSQGISSVYLVTSDDHLPRARVIGEIVFGSKGIKVKPITFESNREAEPIQKTVRDGFRSILWLITGYAGGR
jgi:uncharacterized SAM-binding protein YcdF (DUF218 family)